MTTVEQSSSPEVLTPSQTLSEAVYELSDHSLVDLHNRYHQFTGRFLRIGRDESSMIIVAPASIVDRHDHPRPIFHSSIIQLALAKEGKGDLKAKLEAIKQKAAEDNSNLRNNLEGVQDAGWFYFDVNQAGHPAVFELYGESDKYGRASETGRAETLKLAQKLLSDTVQATIRQA